MQIKSWMKIDEVKNRCEILSCKVIFINEQKSADCLRKIIWHIVQLEKEDHLNNTR